MIKKF
jgi:hypothetical protein